MWKNGDLLYYSYNGIKKLLLVTSNLYTDLTFEFAREGYTYIPFYDTKTDSMLNWGNFFSQSSNVDKLGIKINDCELIKILYGVDDAN